MQNIDIAGLDDQALQMRREEIRRAAAALPGEFEIEGYTFTWEISHTEAIRLSNNAGADYFLNPDGTVEHHYFSSAGGKGADIAETQRYFRMCARVLSDQFRLEVVKDYLSKKETFDSLAEESHLISSEIERRQRQQQEQEQEFANNRREALRRQYEAPGSVWYDYGSGTRYRFVVESATAKSILFKVYGCNGDQKNWNPVDAQRVAREKLIRNGCKARTGFHPIGTDDLAAQKPEEPETLTY